MGEAIYGIVRDAVSRPEGKQGDYSVIETMLDRIYEMNITVRRYGLLALEEELCKIAGESGIGIFSHRKLSGPERLLVVLGGLIVDGTDAESVEQVGINRYYAAAYDRTSAIAACIAIIGMLSIQAGENPHYTMLRMLSILPEEIENKLIDREKDRSRQAAEESKEAQEETQEIPDSFFEDDGKPVIESEIIDGLNKVLLAVDDVGLQKVLMEAGSSDMYHCLCVMSGEAKKKVFANYNKNYALQLYEMMEDGDGGSLSEDEIEEAEDSAVNIIDIVRNLEDSGEVVFSAGKKIRAVIDNVIALKNHKIRCHNLEIETRIAELKSEIDLLKRRLIEN